MPFPYPWQGVRDPLAIPSGAMRHEIQIQQQTTTPDSFGQPQPTWTTVLTAMAAFATLSEREVYQLQFTAQVTHRITVRWPGTSIGIAGGMRVLFGTRVFLIQTPDNVQERNRVLHLMCLEINPVQ
jgi:SPP1 family predicted phage head-tail adaptor